MRRMSIASCLIVLLNMPVISFSNAHWNYRNSLYQSSDMSNLKLLLFNQKFDRLMKWYVSHSFESRFSRELSSGSQPVDYAQADKVLDTLVRQVGVSGHYYAVIGLEWRLANFHRLYPGRTDAPARVSSGELKDSSGKTVSGVTIFVYEQIDPRMRDLALKMMTPHIGAGESWVQYYYCWGHADPEQRIAKTMEFEEKTQDPLAKYAIGVCRYNAYRELGRTDLAAQLDVKLKRMRPNVPSIGRRLVDDRKAK